MKNIISLEENVFKCIMKKLERIDVFIHNSEELLQEIKVLKMNEHHKNNKFSSKEAANFLGVSLRTLHRYKTSDQIACIVYDGKIMYRYEDLIQFEKKQTQRKKNNHIVNQTLGIK